MEELDAFFKGNPHLTPNSRRAYAYVYENYGGIDEIAQELHAERDY